MLNANQRGPNKTKQDIERKSCAMVSARSGVTCRASVQDDGSTGPAAAVRASAAAARLQQRQRELQQQQCGRQQRRRVPKATATLQRSPTPSEHKDNIHEA